MPLSHSIEGFYRCLVQVGNGIELEAFGLQFEPYRWRPCGVTWESSRTVVITKLRWTSALWREYQRPCGAGVAWCVVLETIRTNLCSAMSSLQNGPAQDDQIDHKSGYINDCADSNAVGNFSRGHRAFRQPYYAQVQAAAVSFQRS